jgi:hypothetical protein
VGRAGGCSDGLDESAGGDVGRVLLALTRATAACDSCYDREIRGVRARSQKTVWASHTAAFKSLRSASICASWMLSIIIMGAWSEAGMGRLVFSRAFKVDRDNKVVETTTRRGCHWRRGGCLLVWKNGWGVGGWLCGFLEFRCKMDGFTEKDFLGEAKSSRRFMVASLELANHNPNRRKAHADILPRWCMGCVCIELRRSSWNHLTTFHTQITP